LFSKFLKFFSQFVEHFSVNFLKFEKAFGTKAVSTGQVFFFGFGQFVLVLGSKSAIANIEIGPDHARLLNISPCK